MMEVQQTAEGSGIRQTIQLGSRPFDLIEVCSEKVEAILAEIAHLDFADSPEEALQPPLILEKHVANEIDDAEANEIEITYAVWSQIQAIISGDATGRLARAYSRSASIFQQVYLARFKRDFQRFKEHVMSVYGRRNGADADDVFVLLHLVNYMYLNCQVGIKPVKR